MAKRSKSTPKASTKPQPPPVRFEDTSLALCVVDALVEHDLLETSIRIPELAPEDDDDLDDESESWRDRFENNQTEPINQLVALLEQHRDKLSQLREIHGTLIHIADDYEPDLYSLAGIEACTSLERIEIWSTYPKLDLTPLTSLPALVSVDLICASEIENLEPLSQIESLKQVIGRIPERTAAELRRRNIEIKTSAD